jgi:hypothetical protein
MERIGNRRGKDIMIERMSQDIGRDGRNVMRMIMSEDPFDLRDLRVVLEIDQTEEIVIARSGPRDLKDRISMKKNMIKVEEMLLRQD